MSRYPSRLQAGAPTRNTPGTSSNRRIGSIGIGDGLAAQFGINVRAGTIIAVVRGSVRLKLRYVDLRDPDFFSYAFDLNPATSRRLRLNGTETKSAYNQITRTLVII